MVAGKRKRSRHKTKHEATGALRDLIDTAKASKNLRPGTVGQLRDRWLEHVATTRATNTIETSTRALRFLDEFKTHPLPTLTAGQIQLALDQVSGGRARQLAYDVARNLCRDGITWGWLSTSPLENLKRPKHQRELIQPFSVDETRELLAATAGDHYGAAIHLALSLGLRGGELWGLQWGDLDGRTLKIQRQASQVSATKVEIKTTKSAQGLRSLTLSAASLAALQRQKTKAVPGVPWIFPDDISYGAERREVTKRLSFARSRWGPLLQRLGLEHRGLHHCRHTAATLLLNSGVPLSVVSRMLGHKKISTTVDIYGHLMTGDLERFADRFDELVK